MTTNPTSSEKQILIEILKAVSSGSGEAGPVAGPAGPIGPTGPTGPVGATGPGVPTGGTTGQILAKTSATDFDTEWVEPGSPSHPAIEYVTDTNPTFVAGWEQKIINFTAGSDVNLSLPSDSTIALPVGFTATFRQSGVGQVTVAAGSGATLQSAGGRVKTVAQFSGFIATKIGQNIWWVSGDLEQ